MILSFLFSNKKEFIDEYGKQIFKQINRKPKEMSVFEFPKLAKIIDDFVKEI